MMFLGLSAEFWSMHRRRTKQADLTDVLEELRFAEGALVNALSFGSRGRGRIHREDKEVIVELIDQVRNFIDHLGE